MARIRHREDSGENTFSREHTSETQHISGRQWFSKGCSLKWNYVVNIKQIPGRQKFSKGCSEVQACSIYLHTYHGADVWELLAECDGILFSEAARACFFVSVCYLYVTKQRIGRMCSLLHACLLLHLGMLRISHHVLLIIACLLLTKTNTHRMCFL